MSLPSLSLSAGLAAIALAAGVSLNAGDGVPPPDAEIVFWPALEHAEANVPGTPYAPIRLDRRTGATWSYAERDGRPVWRPAHTDVPDGRYAIVFWPAHEANEVGTSYAPMLLDEETGATWTYAWSGGRIVWHPVPPTAN